MGDCDTFSKGALAAFLMMGKGKAPVPTEPEEAMPEEAEPVAEEAMAEPAGEEIPPEE